MRYNFRGILSIWFKTGGHHRDGETYRGSFMERKVPNVHSINSVTPSRLFLARGFFCLVFRGRDLLFCLLDIISSK